MSRAIAPSSAAADGRDDRAVALAARDVAGHALAGAVAGCAVEAALYPLDTLKTRLQAARAGTRALTARGAYAGVLGNLLGVAPASALFFAAYEPAKVALGRAAGREPGAREHLAAAALGGLVSSVVRVPTEVIKTRRQVGVGGAAGPRAIVRAHGVAGLFVGYWSFLLRDLPFDAIEFAGYEGLKNAWRETVGRDSLSAGEAGVLGAIAGAATGAVTTPLDVVKTRLMTSPETYKSVAHCVRKTVVEEGAMALFKGVQPRVLWIGLGGACFFSVLETARGVFVSPEASTERATRSKRDAKSKKRDE